MEIHVLFLSALKSKSVGTLNRLACMTVISCAMCVMLRDICYEEGLNVTDVP
jgi:hypothetical protein